MFTYIGSYLFDPPHIPSSPSRYVWLCCSQVDVDMGSMAEGLTWVKLLVVMVISGFLLMD